MSGEISGVARGGIYLGYDLGGSFFVGLYRVATAVYYIALHTFRAESYKTAYNEKIKQLEQLRQSTAAKFTQKEIGRDWENFKAESESKKAEKEFDNATGLDKVKKGFGFLKSKADEKLTKGANLVKGVVDDAKEFVEDIGHDIEEVVVTKTLATFEEIERAKMNAWKGELLRGVVELIPIVGGLIYTYYDLSNRLSPLGLDELHFAKEIDDCTDIDLTKLGTYFS